MKRIMLLVSFVSLYIVACAQKENYLLVGTYTSGKSEGIYVYHFNNDTGDFDSVSMVKTVNPSFLAASPNGKFVYAVNELSDKGNGGKVSAFSFNKQNGQLTFVNQQPSHGDDPCYVAVDKTDKWIAIANYTSGSLSILPIERDGGLGDASTVIQHTGKGVDMERQEGPHVHCTVFSKNNKYLFAADLGLDEITTYSFNQRKGTLKPTKQAFLKVDPGTGPRHIAFTPGNKYAYLLTEMGGIVFAYSYKKGKFEKIQSISSLPADYKGAIGSAEIEVSPDGKFVYASNRDESNTIAIFSIDQSTGKLTLVGHQSTLGRTPRNFNFDPSGNFLLVGNQHNDEIVIFKVDKSTGLLTDTGKRIEVGQPVCIAWISE